MKILIIPDIHERYGDLLRLADKIDKADEIVCLGDYFDTFSTTQVHEMCAWLVDRMTDPKFTFLLGNHDCHYLFSSPRFVCSGFEAWKRPIVQVALLKWVDAGSFKLSIERQGFTLSHAGWHLDTVKWNTPEQLEAAIEEASGGGCPRVMGCGYARGGDQPTGGVTWLDFNVEFEDIPGMPQIVGHTQGGKPKGMVKVCGASTCLDTGGGHVGWLKDGKLKVEAL